MFCFYVFIFYVVFYRSFSVKMYTLATVIAMESYSFKIRIHKFDRVVESFFFKIPGTFLDYAKKACTEVYSTQCSSKKERLIKL